MTPYAIYRSALEFVDQTAELPAEVRVRMIRSYLSLLAEPDPEETIRLADEPIEADAA